MPWDIKQMNGRYCVVKQGATSPVPGGCHDTKQQARQHQKALYANEPSTAATAPGVSVTWSEPPTSLRSHPGILDRGTNTSSTGEGVTLAVVEAQPQVPAQDVREPWSGILGVEMSPTADGRLLETDIGHRELPVPFRVQLQSAEGHDGAFNCGRIEQISNIPLADFKKRPDAQEFDLTDVRDGATIIYGQGTLDSSPYAEEAKRILENGSGVSLDGLKESGSLYDSKDLSQIDLESMDFGEALMGVMSGEYLRGIDGDIAGVTVVDMPAFKEAKVMVADGEIHFFRPLTAAAAPVKPPRAWFEDPGLSELTPLRITKEGRIYGHLADWDGCHTGFGDVCVPPFRSFSDYAYFNVGEIETAEGDLVPCGKLMFCRDGNGHAPLDPRMSAHEVSKYYDDATKVGGFVRAGADRYGTWLAGALRPGLKESEIQHLRTHPPSGDWRPIPGKGSELVAAFSVPIPGFPIPRSLVASGNEGQLMVITGPLVLKEMGAREFQRRKAMLSARLKAVLSAEATETFSDGLAYSAEERRRMARSGAALPDGSFPIANCSDAEKAIHAQGRAGNQDRAVAHIKKRVRSLGCSGDIFDPYK